MAWQCILDGALAERARAAVAEATAALAGHAASNDSFPPALLWAYVAGAAEDDAASAERFESAVAALQRDLLRDRNPALYGGLAGRAWAVAHVCDDIDDGLAPIDDFLGDVIAATAAGNYDLVTGLTGLGVYFVERACGPHLARLVDKLAAMAETTRDGITWLTPRELLPPWQQEACPAGHYNAGVAHGVPGTIAVLGAIAHCPAVDDATADRARALCGDALRWLRAQGPDFPGWITAGDGRRDPARFAWCYGAPGIAVAAWGAAARIGDDIAPWRELALACAARTVADEPTVADPNLCHGAAGLGHLFDRCFQTTGEPAFRDAARAWLSRALDLRRPNEGLAGFTRRRAIDGNAARGFEHVTSADLLDGTSGVVLALLAALSDVEPGWDRLLVCDLPPGPAPP